MEKLSVEIEIKKEELDAFNDFIDRECIDKEKYLKRLFTHAILIDIKLHK